MKMETASKAIIAIGNHERWHGLAAICTLKCVNISLTRDVMHAASMHALALILALSDNSDSVTVTVIMLIPEKVSMQKLFL